METRIEVDNIRCSGCAKTITKRRLEIEDIRAVKVDIEHQAVIVESDTDMRAAAIHTLLGLGYPERGSVAGLASFKGKAKSVVSCAIGHAGARVTN
jgi:copper chaperone